MSVAFISKTDLAAYLQRDATLLDDVLVGIALDSACQGIRDVVEQDLDYVANDVVYLDSDGESDILLLPQLPVHKVTEVMRVRDSYILTEGTEYVVDTAMGAICTPWLYPGTRVPFLPGRKAYKVTYSHGFASVEPGGETTVPLWPSSLRIVALTVAARIYDQGLVSQETVGVIQTIYSATEAAVLTNKERNLVEHIVGVGR